MFYYRVGVLIGFNVAYYTGIMSIEHLIDCKLELTYLCEVYRIVVWLERYLPKHAQNKLFHEYMYKLINTVMKRCVEINGAVCQCKSSYDELQLYNNIPFYIANRFAPFKDLLEALLKNGNAVYSVIALQITMISVAVVTTTDSGLNASHHFVFQCKSDYILNYSLNPRDDVILGQVSLFNDHYGDTLSLVPGAYRANNQDGVSSSK